MISASSWASIAGRRVPLVATALLHDFADVSRGTRRVQAIDVFERAEDVALAICEVTIDVGPLAGALVRNGLRSGRPFDEIATAAGASESVRALTAKAQLLRAASCVDGVTTPALIAVVLALTRSPDRARNGATVLGARILVRFGRSRAGRASEHKKQPSSAPIRSSLHDGVRDDAIFELPRLPSRSGLQGIPTRSEGTAGVVPSPLHPLAQAFLAGAPRLGLAGVRRGRCIVNVVPSASVEATSSFPPWASTI